MALLVNGERIENALDEERRALRIALAEKMADEPVSEIEERAREWSRENVIERVLLRQALCATPSRFQPKQLNQSPHLIVTPTRGKKSKCVCEQNG